VARPLKTLIYVLLSLQLVTGVPTDPPRRLYQLTEEQPVGTLVADVRTDFHLSRDQLRFVVLTPTGELGQTLFTIEASSGLLRTATVVDRDTICPGEAECVVTVDIGVQPRRYFQVLKLSVEIVDVNDHSPQFPSSRVELKVSEATVPGILSHINPAEDADGPEFGVTSYQLMSDSRHFDVQLPGPDMPFESPLLVLLEPLDREDQELHQLKIVAKDGGNPARSGSVLIDVIVVDVNDNGPQFNRSSYEVDIVENDPPSSSILAVSASDPDAPCPNADIVYAFSRQSASVASSMFELDPTTGVLSSLVPLDFETIGSSMTFDIIASNPVDGTAAIQTATARITVNVIDVNDNRPSLHVDAAITDSDSSTGSSNIISVPENCPPDSVVAHLSVTDPDTGLGGQVDCSLTGNPVHFRLVHIYDTEFQLLTSSSATLDRETSDGFRLVIACHDNGSPSLSSSVELDIEVEDLNDNIPQFSRAVYNFAVNETNRPGSVLGRVTATDADMVTGHSSSLR